MRFALVGDHPNGVAAARALVQGGRHLLIAVLDQPAPDFAPIAVRHHDLEEILADPAVELVIIASKLSDRGEHLRRAIQAERDVLCVLPCAANIDRVYEATLMQSETKRLLLPLAPMALHPMIERVQQWRAEVKSPLTRVQWECPLPDRTTDFPRWEVLRRLGGEIAEITGLAESEKWDGKGALVVTGRFREGGLFQISTGPGIHEERIRIESANQTQQFQCSKDWQRLSWNCDAGPMETLEFAPWGVLAEELDSQLAGRPPRFSWQDAIRWHELDEALRRSIEKRRTETLDYQEVSADAGSKGTITLIGCAMLWIVVLIFAISIWVPWVRWAVVPMLLGFLALVLIRTLGKGEPPKARSERET